MKGTFCLATHDNGKGTFGGTTDETLIHRTIAEGLVGLMTNPNGNVEIYLKDGDVEVGYRLTLYSVITPEEEVWFRLKKI